MDINPNALVYFRNISTCRKNTMLKVCIHVLIFDNSRISSNCATYKHQILEIYCGQYTKT